MNNLVIYGANKGIAYDGERSEETVVKSIKLTGNNLVIDGIKFSAIQGVEIAGGSDIAIKNSLLGGTPTANSQQMLLASGKVNNLVVEGCKFEGLNNGLAFSHYRAILTNELVTNALIKDNKFIQYAAASVYIDSVKLLKSAGHIEIVENFFDWPGDNFTIFLGSSSIAANTLIDINYNEFSGTEPMSGFTNRYCPATATVNFIGNKLHNVKGTVFEVRGTGASDRTTAFTVNVLNNIIADTSSKLSFSGAVDNVKVDGNYIFQDVVWSNNTATVTNPAASAEGVLEGIKTHKVEFVLDGGSTVANLPAEFVEGAKYPLNYATPTKEGYYFKGWYDNAEFTGEAVTSYGAETADVKLYAKWELIPVYTITYDLDGGTCEGLVESTYEKVDVKLPTPSKFGYVFLGWSLEKGSTEYVTKLNLEANATVYANWLQAEVYTVEYVLNGGSIKYTSREELVNDFVKDYSLLMGKTYQTGADIPTGAWDDIDYHTFFGKSFDDGTTVKSKWLWLGEYLYELSSRDLAYNNCNVLGLKDLLNNGSFAGDNSYGLSYAFRAFLAGSTVRPGTGYTSVDYTVYENANGFWAKLSASENSKLETFGTTVLPTPACGVYKFGGWYDNPEFTGTPITEVTGAAKVYAKWEEAKPVQSVTITNVISEIKRFETYQLTWVLNPTDADIQNVKFYSSDPVVATVDDKGFITTYANGKVKIKVVSDSSTGAFAEFELDVYSPDHFEISYETESYVAVDNNIKLNASYIKRGNVVVNEISWSSLNPEIATVDATGMVVGVKAGVATIRAALTSDANIYVDFTVTVLTGEESEMLKFIIAQNESNVFTRYDLSIGGIYTSDIFSSISKIFYNHEMKINSEYLEAGNATNDYYANSTVEQGLEFITVHYTAGFDATADTDNHASYFTKGTADVSIHYVTGNKGSNGGTPTDEIYATLDHKNGAWHAGDSNARYYSNSDKKVGEDLVFSWMKTGVAYDNVDLMDVVWTVSDDFYYVINGQKTEIKLPETYNFKSRNTNHIYNADGTISSQSNFTGGAFTNRTPESFFNSQGFPVTVIDGEYYMGPTWWSYGQVTEGRICGVGGNLSSIGIESCVNQGSDLWYTWQVTAQLVASLMIQYDLSIERVKGHHFFDGKNCPQPMLEHDLEIWYEFLELVEAEYELLKTYKDYEVKMTLDGTYDFVSEYGRITEQPEFASVIKYTVEIKKGSTTETITLASSVNGIYSK